MSRVCKTCAKPITDKTRSAQCKDHRGPNTHIAKPSVRWFAEAGS